MTNTIFTKLETISGRLAVSAINPAAMTNASVAAGEKPSATSMAITMGVRIRAAPSLANSADTAAPSNTMKANSLTPLPPPQRAKCKAAHSQKPASSSKRLMMMTATKVWIANGLSRFSATRFSAKRVHAPWTGALLVPAFAPEGSPTTPGDDGSCAWSV